MQLRRLLLLIVCLLLAACAPQPAPRVPSGLAVVTAIPTQSAAPSTSTPVPIVTVVPAPRTCSDATIADLLGAVPAYRPGDGPFAAIVGEGFYVRDQPLRVRGVTYVPQARDLIAADLPAVAADLARLRDLGITTVRLFIPYAPLFTCPGHGAVPVPDAVAHLDAVIRLIDAHGLRVIPVLHHGAGTPTAPLYTAPGDTLAQTAFLVTRYRDEPAVLAWDLRDSGDADYAAYTRDVVLAWLSRTAAAVRELDTRHPITAGWGSASDDTIPLVDVVSLQHYSSAADLRQRVAGLRAQTTKPLLLVAFGVSSGQVNETAQANTLRTVIRAAEGDRLAGWLIWTLYDTVPDSVDLDPACASDPCRAAPEIRAGYGLWRADGSPKPAVETLATLLRGS